MIFFSSEPLPRRERAGFGRSSMVSNRESPKRDSQSVVSGSSGGVTGPSTGWSGCLDSALIDGAAAREDDAVAGFLVAVLSVGFLGFAGFVVCCLRTGG